MNISIRPLAYADYARINTIDVATQKQYLGDDAWGKMTESEQQVRLVSRKKDFAWHLACGFCFVAVAESIVSGFIYAYEIPNTHKVYIEYIAVVPSMQKMGIGQKLFAALRVQCRKNHIRSIWSLINTDNTRSLKFHQRAGCVLRPRIEAEYLL